MATNTITFKTEAGYLKGWQHCMTVGTAFTHNRDAQTIVVDTDDDEDAVWTIGRLKEINNDS